MHEEDDVLNTKAILLAVGGAALAGLLFVLARRDEQQEPAEHAEAAAHEAGKQARKAAKAARKKRGELAAAVSENGEQRIHGLKERAAERVDAKTAERELKAAAWDAQQEAREAESRLRSAGHRVVDDATHLASWVGSEARSLAGDSRERLSHLRRRAEDEGATEREIARLRAEIDDLRAELSGAGRKSERDLSRIAARFSGKGGTVPEGMASEAAAAALSQLERTLKAKAPALLAARNRGQVLEILQQELGPTLRETAMQAAAAALAKWETARDEGAAASSEARHRAELLGEDVRAGARKAREAAKHAADDAREAADAVADDARADGTHRFWRRDRDPDAMNRDLREALEETTVTISEDSESAQEEHRGKAGLFWGGAGLGLALYALLDAERREHVLRLANEASIQVQELVRDLQGYDDEF